MAKNHDKLLAVAKYCHTSFHKEMCSPVDLFKVEVFPDGYIYLVPNHDRSINYFSGGTMTFIGDYLNSHGVCWLVVWRSDSVAIRLLDE